MDCVVHGVTKSQTRLSVFHFFIILSLTVSFSCLKKKKWMKAKERQKERKGQRENQPRIFLELKGSFPYN